MRSFSCESADWSSKRTRVEAVKLVLLPTDMGSSCDGGGWQPATASAEAAAGHSNSKQHGNSSEVWQHGNSSEVWAIDMSLNVGRKHRSFRIMSPIFKHEALYNDPNRFLCHESQE